MSILGVIPARYGSVRFPGKPLVPILGKTLIQRTYENAKQCDTFDEIVVATDDHRIFDHVHAFGGKAVMTSSTCPTGTDRVVEVLNRYKEYDSFSIVVNVQGDEPCLAPEIITKITQSLIDSDAEVSTPVSPLLESDAHNPNVVKCVMDQRGYALYFSRALIPAGKKLSFQSVHPYYRHIGVYAFKRHFLMKYTQLPPTPLQLAEDVEQLKILEHGYRIKVVVVNEAALGVDIPDDIKKVEHYLCQQSTFLSQAGLSPHSAKG